MLKFILKRIIESSLTLAVYGGFHPHTKTKTLTVYLKNLFRMSLSSDTYFKFFFSYAKIIFEASWWYKLY